MHNKPPYVQKKKISRILYWQKLCGIGANKQREIPTSYCLNNSSFCCCWCGEWSSCRLLSICCDSQSIRARQRTRCSFSKSVWTVKTLDAFRAKNGSLSARTHVALRLWQAQIRGWLTGVCVCVWKLSGEEAGENSPAEKQSKYYFLVDWTHQRRRQCRVLPP